MQAVLGKDMPYKDMGSLRRALRADKDSFAYKKSHYAVRDYNQYDRWKSILGEENMPKSLADFQDLKYNKHNEFVQLEIYKTALEKISKKTWSDSFKAKAVQACTDFRANGYVLNEHSAGRFCHRLNDIDFALNILKQPANYIQSDGRKVCLYDGYAIVYEEETKQIISFINRGGPKDDWKKI